MPRVRRLLHFALLFVSCGPCREKPPPPVERAGVPGRSGGASIHGTVRFRGTPPAPPRISRGSFAECAKAPALPATPLGVASGADLTQVVADWTGRMYREWRAVHQVDVYRGNTLFRVFLLADTLQVVRTRASG